jgi:hypothetical protein
VRDTHPGEVVVMIYELRVYRAVSGKLPDLLNRFRDETIRFWERYGIRHVGFWTTAIGDSNNDLTYLLSWDSLADRDAKWSAFESDPAWLAVREKTERSGEIVETLRNQILRPTSFSGLK